MKPTILALLLVVALLGACTPPATNETPNPTPEPPAEAVVLTAAFGGAYSPMDMQFLTVTATSRGALTIQTTDGDRKITREYKEQISEAELAQFKDMIANVGTLEPTYGVGNGIVMDAGYAEYEIEGKSTRVDPNIGDAYPANLAALHDWIGKKMEPIFSMPLTCAGYEKGGPCTKEYMPVCGSDNSTYGNKCAACSTVGVDSYVGGACAGDEQQLPEDQNNGDRLAFTQCTDPRPEICTMEYNPVCGEVDTGIRCITEPCPSTERVTFSTGCTACSNSSVVGYWPGACDDMPSDTPTKPSAKCSAGQVMYDTQVDRRCIDVYTKADVMNWKACTTQNTCASDEHCVYATRSPDGTQFNWSGAPSAQGLYKESLRCAPDAYYNYLVQTSGASGVDENGEFYSIIA